VASLSAQQVKQLYEAGDADRVALYAVRNVTTGDTFDFAADFSLIKRAIMMAATASSQAVASVSASTTITMPAGLSGDAAYILAWGCAT